MAVIDQVRPGIVALFGRKGYAASVTAEAGGKLKISLARGDFRETRSFPVPSTNKELSPLLLQWVEELS